MAWVEILFDGGGCGAIVWVPSDLVGGSGGGGADVCVLAEFVGGGGGAFRRRSSCSRIVCACRLMNSVWSLDLFSATPPPPS